MDRRGFLGSILALGLAPAIVRASSLMPVIARIPDSLILYGDGIHDDTKAMQALLDGQRVLRTDGTVWNSRVISGGIFQISETLHLRGDGPPVTIRNSVFEWDGDANGLGPYYGSALVYELHKL